MLQSLIENISEIVVVIDAEGIIRFSNPQLERVLGLRSQDVVGRNIFDFINPDDVHRAKLEYSETVRKLGEGVPSVLRIRDAEGVWIPFEIIANNQLKDRDIRGVIFTARDLRFRREVERTIRRANADLEKRVEERVTELAKANAALRLEIKARRDTERRLQETVSLLNATLNSTADGILVVSIEGTVSSCNRRFLDMWHLRCSVGQADRELLATAAGQLQDPDGFIRQVEAVYSDPSATSFDVLHFQDGRIYERYSEPQRLEGRIVGRVWSFRDISQAEHLEQELRHSQKIEAMGRLAGSISHDFNNLLMLISGYLGQLTKSGLLPDQKKTCEEALVATKRAATLTRQLLAFSRKHQDAPAVTDLNAIVENVKVMLRSLVSDRVRLEISLCDDPVPVLADISQLEIVLMNLAINAQDAMPDGGLLSIATGREQNGSETFATLTISDTGRGIPPEVRARIFEPFFTTKQLGKGTGLGLSTVYGIVQRSLGHIEVESAPNKGAQFRVYLPATTVPAAASTATPSPILPARGHETILLAEDEAGIRAMTKAYLEGLGYRVLEAVNGAEAVKVAGEYNGIIDLVITDILMPILRGDAAVNTIRERRPKIKALYISGYSEPSMPDAAAAAAAALLFKPFEFPELGNRVRSVLDSDTRKQAKR